MEVYHRSYHLHDVYRGDSMQEHGGSARLSIL